MGGSDLDDPYDRLSLESIERLRRIGEALAVAGNPFLQARVQKVIGRERAVRNDALCRAPADAGTLRPAYCQAAEEALKQAARGINVYTCPNGHETVTVDLDEGVTPFMLRCRSGCAEMAQSSCYRVPPGKIPAWEWYRPSKAERKKLGRAMKDHVDLGGLVIRAISARRPDIDPGNLPPALKGARLIIREGKPRRGAPAADKRASKLAIKKRTRKANRGRR